MSVNVVLAVHGRPTLSNGHETRVQRTEYFRGLIRNSGAKLHAAELQGLWLCRGLECVRVLHPYMRCVLAQLCAHTIVKNALIARPIIMSSKCAANLRYIGAVWCLTRGLSISRLLRSTAATSQETT